MALSLRFPHQNPVHTFPLHHTRYMPRPSHSSRFMLTLYRPYIWIVTFLHTKAHIRPLSSVWGKRSSRISDSGLITSWQREYWISQIVAKFPEADSFFFRTGCVIIVLLYINILLGHVCSSSRTNASEGHMLLHRFVYEITALLTNLDTIL